MCQHNVKRITLLQALNACDVRPEGELAGMTARQRQSFVPAHSLCSDKIIYKTITACVVPFIQVFVSLFPIQCWNMTHIGMRFSIRACVSNDQHAAALHPLSTSLRFNQRKQALLGEILLRTLSNKCMTRMLSLFAWLNVWCVAAMPRHERSPKLGISVFEWQHDIWAVHLTVLTGTPDTLACQSQLAVSAAS